MTTFQIVSASFALASAACGGGGGGGTGDSCTGSESRCQGDDFQTCNGDNFEVQETCAGSTVCDPTIGCAACSPAGGTFCNGDTVVSCGGDGTIGGDVETCDPGTCTNGTCGGNPVGCDASGVQLVYVVTVNNQLLSFDPEKLGTASDPFASIGTLSCPAGASLTGLGPGTPFSMSVDRDAKAWVLYSSGEVFHVSTTDASCTPTSFATRQQGFDLFGMGFVSDSPGSPDETLFIAGGSALQATPGDLGMIDTSAMTVSSIGGLPSGEFGPELTGTGDAKLFGYYPSQSNSYVAEMDKASGMSSRMLALAPLNGAATAWAFAHHGGSVYIFISTGGGFGSPEVSRVLKQDLTSGMETVAIPDSPHRIVGAGVSTCAPVVIE